MLRVDFWFCIPVCLISFMYHPFFLLYENGSVYVIYDFRWHLKWKESDLKFIAHTYIYPFYRYEITDICDSCCRVSIVTVSPVHLSALRPIKRSVLFSFEKYGPTLNQGEKTVNLSTLHDFDNKLNVLQVVIYRRQTQRVCRVRPMSRYEYVKNTMN